MDARFSEKLAWPPIPQLTLDDLSAAGLPPTDQLQIGADGRYFVEDFLGCRWEEWSREAVTPDQTDVLLLADCTSEFQLDYIVELDEFTTVIVDYA